MRASGLKRRFSQWPGYDGLVLMWEGLIDAHPMNSLTSSPSGITVIWVYGACRYPSLSTFTPVSTLPEMMRMWRSLPFLSTHEHLPPTNASMAVPGRALAT